MIPCIAPHIPALAKLHIIKHLGAKVKFFDAAGSRVCPTTLHPPATPSPFQKLKLKRCNILRAVFSLCSLRLRLPLRLCLASLLIGGLSIIEELDLRSLHLLPLSHFPY